MGKAVVVGYMIRPLAGTFLARMYYNTQRIYFPVEHNMSSTCMTE